MITLYHGTSAKYLNAILKNGLQPRDVTKNSNYDGDFISHGDLVYLTDSHPMFYAVRAVEKEDVLILKFKVYERELYPDEDYVAQVIARQQKLDRSGFDAKLRQLHASGQVNPRKYQHAWRDSLKSMGTVACKPLPASRIVAHATAPYNFMKLGHFGADTNPTSGIGRSFVKDFYVAEYVPRIEALLRDGYEKTWAEIEKALKERHEKLKALKIIPQDEDR